MKRAAPTGTAAFLIGGKTLHSLFRLTPKTNTKMDIEAYQPGVLNEVQNEFSGCNLLVIDEKSMVGVYMLYRIDQRLKEITGKKTKSFGGMSIVLLGDFAQLPPIGDKPMYTTDLRDDKASCYQNKGSALFKEFKTTFVLSQAMRQMGPDQEQFRNVLDRISRGEMDIDDWNFLNKRNIENIPENEKERFLEEGIKICALNKSYIEFNVRRVKALGTPLGLVKSENTNATIAALNSEQAEGLPAEILLAKGCYVRLTLSLWSECGLTNGARGYVRYAIYNNNEKPPMLPCFVIVEFPSYIGPAFLKPEDVSCELRESVEKFVPIKPELKRWYRNKKLVFREMLPLKLAYGTSIHSTQGLTMKGKVLIDLGPREFAAGLVYTAISRCKRLEDILFDPMSNCRRFCLKKNKVFKDRQNQLQGEKDSSSVRSA